MKKISTEKLIELEKQYVFSSEVYLDTLLIKKNLGDLILSIQFEYELEELVCFQSWINILDKEGYDDCDWTTILNSSDIQDYDNYEDILCEIFDNAKIKSENYNWLINQIDKLIDRCNSKDFDDEFIKSIILSRL